jgi:hypothetical protein
MKNIIILIIILIFTLHSQEYIEVVYSWGFNAGYTLDHEDYLKRIKNKNGEKIKFDNEIKLLNYMYKLGYRVKFRYKKWVENAYYLTYTMELKTK